MKERRKVREGEGREVKERRKEGEGRKEGRKETEHVFHMYDNKVLHKQKNSHDRTDEFGLGGYIYIGIYEGSKEAIYEGKGGMEGTIYGGKEEGI